MRRRELTVNAREEWMQKKEGEFRSAQRVAEHARYEFMLLLEFFFETNLLFNFICSNGAIAALAGSQFDSSPHAFPLSHGNLHLFLVLLFIFASFCLVHIIFSYHICLLFFGYGLLTLPSDAQVALRSKLTHRPILHKVAAVAVAPCLHAES